MTKSIEVQKETQRIEKEKIEQEKANKISALASLRSKTYTDGMENIKIIQPKTDIFEKLNNGEDVTIVFLGDSTTEKNIFTNGKPGHVEVINNTLSPIYGSKLHVVNAGISGHTIQMMLDRLDTSVINHRPDLVVINSGINDVGHNVSKEEFESTYKIVIEQIREKTDAEILVRTSNPTMGKETNDAMEENINPVVFSLAEEYDLGYVDLYSYYQDVVEGDSAGIEKYNYNYSHPNELGQSLIANLVLYSILLDAK